MLLCYGRISLVGMLLATGGTGAITASKKEEENGRRILEDPIPSLVDLVVNTDAFSTLETLVIKAGLVEALSADGPFTVLAPLDSAFADLLTAAPTLATNLVSLDSWNVHLTDVLLYHVVLGQATSQDLLGSELAVTMLNNENITVTTVEGTMLELTDVTGGVSKVVDPFDVMASNGVAHSIDRVLLPSWVVTNIIDLGKSAGGFEIVLSLLVQTGLDAALMGYGDDSSGLTLFAPQDSAFDGIDVSSLTDEQITGILLYHVVSGVAASTTLATGSVPTLQGGNIDLVVAADGSVTVNGISVVFADALANNGIVHVIDQVLIPPPVEKCPPSNTARTRKNRTRA